MKIAYKAFEPGFVCRGVKFKPLGEKNVTAEANCVRNGWHCAEDPADCLSYYPNFKRSVYCLVGVEGDMDEDGTDTKISCTELTILRVLDPVDYMLHILIYMAKNPAKRCFVARQGRAEAHNGYAVVRGLYPCAKGELGDVLAFAREEKGQIVQLAVHVVDGKTIPANTYINIDGKVEE